MGLVPVQPDFVAGTPIVASEVNRKFDDIIEVVNGGIDDANVYQLSADKITSGVFHQDRIPRLRLDQLPRDYNPEGGFSVLSVRQPGSDPEYRRITWDDVVLKPVTAIRWPSWSEVSSKPSTATRWPSWSEVSSKPSTFPPSSHSHSWSSITGKPSTFPPSDHSANLLTSGTVPIARIATGATNNTRVAPGQDMTGSVWTAQHPVGSLRLVRTNSSTHTRVSPGEVLPPVMLALRLTDGGWGSSGNILPGTWQALSGIQADARGPVLAVRIS